MTAAHPSLVSGLPDSSLHSGYILSSPSHPRLPSQWCLSPQTLEGSQPMSYQAQGTRACPAQYMRCCQQRRTAPRPLCSRCVSLYNKVSWSLSLSFCRQEQRKEWGEWRRRDRGGCKTVRSKENMTIHLLRSYNGGSFSFWFVTVLGWCFVQ